MSLPAMSTLRTNIPNYPKGGVMSQHLERLDIGDTVTFAGPLGTTNFTEKHFRRLAIAVGGTGITPMLQIIHRILKNPEDKTEIWMLFRQQHAQRHKLDHLAEKHPQQFHVWYTASLPDETWKYSVGHVTQEMIQRYLPPPEDSAAVICGPPAFKTKARSPAARSPARPPEILRFLTQPGRVRNAAAASAPRPARMLTAFAFRSAGRLALLASAFYFYRNYWQPSMDDMTVEKMNGTLATFTSADVVVRLRLIEKWSISPNTRIFRFALPSAEHTSGLGPGDHVKISAEINGKTVSRKYTHTSDDYQRGFIDFLVKIYGPNEHPEYPEGGLLTPWLDSLQINEEANFTGPVGRISYRGDGLFRIREKRTHVERERRFRRLGMLAGEERHHAALPGPERHPQEPKRPHGGVAPVRQQQARGRALERPNWTRLPPNTPLVSTFGTRSHAPPPTGRTPPAYITKEMISLYLPPADEHTGVVLCGPKAMRNEACIPNLHALGFTDDQLVIF
ncbi:Cytochrome-b5 reductase [Aphelenchoides fujianensis]|nr:Cytochrome-b5 reductase [Aphelenchoides fujianensis]